MECYPGLILAFMLTASIPLAFFVISLWIVAFHFPRILFSFTLIITSSLNRKPFPAFYFCRLAIMIQKRCIWHFIARAHLWITLLNRTHSSMDTNDPFSPLVLLAVCWFRAWILASSLHLWIHKIHTYINAFCNECAACVAFIPFAFYFTILIQIATDSALNLHHSGPLNFSLHSCRCARSPCLSLWPCISR